MKSSSYKTHYQMIQEFIKNNKVIFALWSIVMITLFGIMDFNISQKIEGYASIETVDINFNQAVTVRKVYRSVGETVKAGSLLLTLENKDLSIEIARKETEIESLTKKIEQAKAISANEIINVLSSDLKILKNELNILRNKENELSVYAQYDCIISNIYFSKGEYIAAFTDIMTVQKKETTLVNAFINEYEQSNYKIGQSVVVESLDRSRIAKGEIILASNDISQAPDRLNDVQLTNNWGQKLVIKLQKPLFKRGEKLMIQVLNNDDTTPFFSSANAGINEEKKVVTIFKSKKELSAIRKLSDKLFLVSDDEGKKINKSLFLYDLEHNKIKEIIVDKNEDIEDVESIIVDQERVILFASHSKTRKGKTKKDRNKVIILEKNNNDSFSYIKTLSILNQLEINLKQTLSSDFEIEIESAEVSGNDYIFALKNTVNEKIIIIKINKNAFMQENIEEIKISQLQTPIQGTGLTSMKVINERVYLVLNDEDESHIFETNLDFQDTEYISSVDEKVEGIEVFQNYFLLSVDENKKNGKILRHKYAK